MEKRRGLWSGLLIGGVAGTLGGLVGVGGGVVMVPLMVFLLKFRQHDAHGTSLVAVAFTGIAGAAVYWLHGSVEIAASLVLAATATATVRLGVHCCSIVSDARLKRYFGAFLIVVSVLLVAKPYLPSLVGADSGLRWLFLVVLGLLTGFLSGLLGVGGGIFMVPMMVLLAGIPQHLAQGISLLAMIPSSSLGAWTHWKKGNVRPEVVPGLIAGVLAGVYLGGSAAHLLPEAKLRILFTALLLYTGYRFLRTRSAAPPARTP